jgi:uncharacterized SAM-binding protein YcdF (DUF218 family)
MFFPISKIFWAIAEPITFLVLLGLIGVLLGFTRFARTGRVIMAAAILGLALGLLTPLGAVLLRPLEERFPQPPADLPGPAAIIVLGGSVEPRKSEAHGQVILSTDATRMTAGVELARKYPKAPLVFTGGSALLLSEGPPEADAARDLWLALGVEPERMIFETKSRNTWENALFTRELLNPQPGDTYILVTSAWHMPRSVGIFRRAGMNIIPFPVAYHTFGDGRDFGFNTAIVERLAMLDFSFREWVGLLAYRLTDKTDALFPAP